MLLVEIITQNQLIQQKILFVKFVGFVFFFSLPQIITNFHKFKILSVNLWEF